MQSEWISVGEALPEKDVHVLVCGRHESPRRVGKRFIEIAWWGDGVWDGYNLGTLDVITHWMILPPLPPTPVD